MQNSSKNRNAFNKRIHRARFEREREREFLSGSMFYFSEQGIQESDVL